MGKTWKDSAYAKIRLPRVKEGKAFKDSRFPARNNSKVRIKGETRHAEDDSEERDATGN